VARYDHLRLTRLPERLERRKRTGFGSAPERDPSVHGPRLKREVDAVLTDFRRVRPAAINPSLILRVRMDSLVTEDQWASIGLTLLASDPDRSLVLFASEQDLRTFQQRLAAYSGPVPQGQANPPYAGFVASIASVEPVGPGDRIGRRFRTTLIPTPAMSLTLNSGISAREQRANRSLTRPKRLSPTLAE